MKRYNLITVLGPTAAGKTAFGANLAARLNGEIISADSRQVYREMDIGTGKDYEDYVVNGKKVPVHLIDMHPPGYKYNVYEFHHDFNLVFRNLRQKNVLPLLVGGTGLYIQAVLDRYHLINVPVNPELRERMEAMEQQERVRLLKQLNLDLHNTTDTLHKKRTIRAIEIADHYRHHPEQGSSLPEIRSLILGLNIDRNARRSRISRRLQERLSEGMITEVEKLLEKVSEEDLVFYGLEYKFITLYLKGELTYDDMYQRLETAIHQFAKRQMTWFRRMERQGFRIHWIDALQDMDQKMDLARKIIGREDPKHMEKWQT